MKNLRSVALVVMVAAEVACASKARPSAITSLEPVSEDLIVLLRDADGSVGAATVSNAGGTTELSAALTSTRILHTNAPSPAVPVTEADITRLFGEVLTALAPEPQHFTLYFLFDSDQLTAESQSRLAEVLRVVKDYPAPDVAIVGHTDTAGPARLNYDLGLNRAKTVRKLLLATALEPTAIEVRSHGEADPLVKTADAVAEPRNRRVEITVR